MILEQNVLENFLKNMSNFLEKISSIYEFSKYIEDQGSLVYTLNKSARKNKEVYHIAIAINELNHESYKTVVTPNERKRINYLKENIIINSKEGKATSKSLYIKSALTKFVNVSEEGNKIAQQQRNMSIMNICSSFEIFVSDLIKHEILNINIEGDRRGAYIRKLQLHYEDLMDGESVYEIKERFVEKYINDLMYKDVDTWLNQVFGICLSSEDKKALTEDTELIGKITELFQARNLLVHNNGIVNRVYLQKIKNSQYVIGDYLNIDENYMEDKMKCLLLIASKLFTKNIKKNNLMENKTEVYSFDNSLNDLLVKYLKYGAAIRESYKYMADYHSEHNDELSVFVARVNIWLTYYLDKEASSEEDGESKQYCEKVKKSDIYNQMLVRYGVSLLENDEMRNQIEFAIKLLEDVIHGESEDNEKNVIQCLNYVNLPMFDPIREEKEFIDFVEELSYPEIAR